MRSSVLFVAIIAQICLMCYFAATGTLRTDAFPYLVVGFLIIEFPIALLAAVGIATVRHSARAPKTAAVILATGSSLGVLTPESILVVATGVRPLSWAAVLGVAICLGVVVVLEGTASLRVALAMGSRSNVALVAVMAAVCFSLSVLSLVQFIIVTLLFA